MLDVKEILYTKISSLGIPVQDNPEGQGSKTIPYGILRTINVLNTNYKNYKKVNWLMRLDVFSKYKGEAEILNYYNEGILPMIDEIQKIEQITYVQPTLTIMDEKETGPIAKHGVITIAIETMEV